MLLASNSVTQSISYWHGIGNRPKGWAGSCVWTSAAQRGKPRASWPPLSLEVSVRGFPDDCNGDYPIFALFHRDFGIRCKFSWRGGEPLMSSIETRKRVIVCRRAVNTGNHHAPDLDMWSYVKIFVDLEAQLIEFPQHFSIWIWLSHISWFMFQVNVMVDPKWREYEDCSGDGYSG